MKKALIPGTIVAVFVGAIVLTHPNSTIKEGVEAAKTAAKMRKAKLLQHGDWRVAVAGKQCLIDAGVTVDKLHKHCLWHEVKGDYVVCVTDREVSEAHPCEVDPLTVIPDSWFRRVVVCAHQENGQEVRGVYYPKLEATLPAGWNCEVILNQVIWMKSMRGVKSRLLEAMQNKCCSSCQHGCFVHAGSWGQCPYCLLDNNCAGYCPAPETP